VIGQQRLFPTPQTSLTTDDWYTPRWIFDKLELTFDLDVASPPGGVPWIPAHQYLTQAEDGLATPWHGLVWMNPPFSDPAPWINKFISYKNGVALVPTTIGKWQERLWQSDAQWVNLPPIRFESPTNGTAKTALPRRCWLVGFNVTEALSKIGKVR
jgi:hypothetical protein